VIKFVNNGNDQGRHRDKHNQYQTAGIDKAKVIEQRWRQKTKGNQKGKLGGSNPLKKVKGSSKKQKNKEKNDETHPVTDPYVPYFSWVRPKLSPYII